jgi:RNA 2',3'-cyclic 3'-phosphodiesterase
MPPLRLFIAAETPPPVRAAIAGLRDTLKQSGADVRWEHTDKFHITLRFLGETNPELLRVFVPLLEGAAARRRPIGVRYSGLGCFPHRDDPRVLWVGVDDPDGELGLLQQEIEKGCRAIGMAPEPKAFHAHVTIGRVKGRRNLGGLLAMMESATFQSLAAPIGSICLMKSELQPGGSVYNTLNRFSLQA